MKLNYLVLIIFTLFSCCLSKIEKQKKINQTTKSSEEEFSEFYIKFSSNNKFRKSRTIFPLRYITIDYDIDSRKDTATEEMLKVFPLELNKRKWKEKVLFNLIPINSDSAKVVIGIEDTGYHVVIYFRRDSENKKWYAIKVEDSST